ncbi:hypothetical protein Z949_3693 [Sulfitobacter guttiformis KCTC 32187]|nr:hypothetical protein Z949_3693 [Sulfitobacter guttiformis KCTC 32187]
MEETKLIGRKHTMTKGIFPAAAFTVALGASVSADPSVGLA